MHHSHIDKFAYQDSWIHRLDSRVKFITTVVFTAVVISLPYTSLSILACYAVGPFTILVIAAIPIRFVLKQTLLVSPFVLVLALSCPFYDKSPFSFAFGPFICNTTVGWMKCWSILAKFFVTMSALVALVSTTRFSNLLAGMRRLGVPKLLVIQLGFLYRYIFVLIDTVGRMLRARNCRRLRNLGFIKELKIASAMIGSLLTRSIDKAERIHIAMQGRGFDGTWHSISRLHAGSNDLLFVFIGAVFIFGLYFVVRPLLG